MARSVRVLSKPLKRLLGTGVGIMGGGIVVGPWLHITATRPWSCGWRRQDRIDRSLVPGLTSAEKSELAAAKRRVAELAINRLATEHQGHDLPRRASDACATAAVGLAKAQVQH